MSEVRIADAMNTYKYALTVIRDKGYKIFLLPDSREEYLGDYWAYKDGRDFIGGDPLRVLGLIGIWEQFGDEWYTNPKGLDRSLDDRILSRALPDSAEDYHAFTDEEFAAFKADYKLFFETLELDPFPEDLNREGMYELIEKTFFTIDPDEEDQ